MSKTQRIYQVLKRRCIMYKDIFKNKRVLITGGLGFIGSNLAIKLHQLGAKIEIVDALIPEHGGNLFNITLIKQYIKIHIFKIEEDEDALSEIVSRQDVIFNLAGQSSHWDSMIDPKPDLNYNCSSHLTLLEAVRNFNPNIKVIYSSTRQIYGKPEFLPVNENHPIQPIDINGIHKAAGEQYHLLYHKIYGLKTVALRLTNTYGPHMRVVDTRQTFLGYWLRCAVEQKEFEVWDGAQRRDFNYIDDVVEALLLSASNDKSIGKIYNLGSSEHYSLLQVAELFSEFLNCKYIIKDFPKNKKSIDIGDYYSDYALIKNDLYWNPNIDLKTGLKFTFNFLKSHIDQYTETYAISE